MESKHTPGPWEVNIAPPPHKTLKPIIIVRVSETPLKYTPTIALAVGCDKTTDLANAQFIVRACNAHEELLEALKLSRKYVAKMVADDVQTVLHPQVALDRLEQAIAKAEGKEGEG